MIEDFVTKETKTKYLISGFRNQDGKDFSSGNHTFEGLKRIKNLGSLMTTVCEGI